MIHISLHCCTQCGLHAIEASLCVIPSKITSCHHRYCLNRAAGLFVIKPKWQVADISEWLEVL